MRTKPPTIGDLAMLVLRLARIITNTMPRNPVAVKALDYLRRHDLIGSPLRSDGTPAPSAEDWENACHEVLWKVTPERFEAVRKQAMRECLDRLELEKMYFGKTLKGGE